MPLRNTAISRRSNACSRSSRSPTKTSPTRRTSSCRQRPKSACSRRSAEPERSMDAAEAEAICDQLAELASKGPSKDAPALVQVRALLRRVTQANEATPYVKERATDVDRALSGWL